MNPTKRERIAMLTKENEDLKTQIMMAQADRDAAQTALQAKLAEPAPTLHGVLPVRVEYRTDPVLEQKCQTLEKELAASSEQLAAALAAYTWQPRETSPENKPILVRYDGPINEIGDAHVHIRRGQWWFAPGYDGRRLHAPKEWMEIPS